MVIDENLPDLKRYQAVIVAVEPRTTMKALDQLKSYVQEGGVLMVADDCLKINDDRNAPLADRSWLGGSGDPGAAQNGTVLGGGRIYHLSADASLPQLQHTVGALLSRSKIEPDLRVEKQGAAAPDYVEAQSFGGAQGRVAWYLLNWGADCHARIGASNFEANKSYRVRNAADRKVMPSPNGQPTWTGEQLAKGVDLALPCQDPQLILIEPADLSPMALEPISPQQQERIDQNWHQTLASKKRILFDTLPCNERMTPVRIPTARAIMEKAGWGVYVALDPVTAQEPIRTWDGGAFDKQKLEDFQLLVYACPQGNMHLPAQALKDVKQYVANGGGVLLLANPPHGPHGWLSPNSVNQLSDLFGVHVDRHMVSDPAQNRDHQPLWPIMTDMASHPLVAGVKRYDPDGTAWLRIKKGSPAQVLIRSGRSADPAGAPVAAAVSYGKGRVVIMGSGYWLEPTVLDQADNRRLLSNILDWLSGGETQQP